MVTITKDALAREVTELGWTIGDFTYGVPYVQPYGSDSKLHIGKYGSIAPDVRIMMGGNHRPDWVTTYPFSVLDHRAHHIPGQPMSKGDVVLGHDVWLSQGCLIMSGVTIGHGAVVAANAVVVRDVPPYGIVGGNPARLIRKRFSEEQIAALLEIKWWDWHPDEIARHYDIMLSQDIDGFIAAARQKATAPVTN